MDTRTIFTQNRHNKNLEFYEFPSRNHLPNYRYKRFVPANKITLTDKTGANANTIPAIEYAKKHYVAIDKGIRKCIISYNYSGSVPVYSIYPINTNTMKSDKIAVITDQFNKKFKDYRLADLWEDMFAVTPYTSYTLISNSVNEYQLFTGWYGEYQDRIGNIDSILDYIKSVTGDNYKRFMCWLAEVIQHPGKQTQTIPFFKHRHIELINFICKCIGEKLVWKYPTLRQLMDNNGVVDKVLIVLDRVPTTRDKFHEYSTHIITLARTPNISVICQNQVNTYTNYCNIILMGKEDDFIKQYKDEINIIYINGGENTAPPTELNQPGNYALFIDMLQDLDTDKVIYDTPPTAPDHDHILQFLKEVDVSDFTLTRENWYKFKDIYSKYKDIGGECKSAEFKEHCIKLGYVVKRYRLNTANRNLLMSIKMR
jgi:hypothetical protein